MHVKWDRLISFYRAQNEMIYSQQELMKLPSGKNLAILAAVRKQKENKKNQAFLAFKYILIKVTHKYIYI